MTTPSVRRAVIPAAGRGTRFLPATKVLPKEMFPVVDKPAIQYVVEEAITSGIQEVLIVTCHGKELIEDHFDRAYDWERTTTDARRSRLRRLASRVGMVADIYYLRQKGRRGLGQAVMCASKWVGTEPFAVLLPDVLTVADPPCLAQLIELFHRWHCPTIAVHPVAPRLSSFFGIVRATPFPGSRQHLLAEELVEKPAADRAPSNLAITGRYVLTPEIFDSLQHVQPDRTGEIQLTDALNLLARVRPVHALVFTGSSHHLNDTAGFLRASIELALARPEFRPQLVHYLAELSRHLPGLETEGSP